MQKSIASNIFYKILLNTFNIILPILVGPYAYRTLGAIQSEPLTLLKLFSITSSCSPYLVYINMVYVKLA